MPSRRHPVGQRPCASQLPVQLSALSLAIGTTLVSLIASTTVALPAHAAEAVDSTARKNYTVPAGKLGDALAHFAAAAGVPLSFDPAVLADQRSNGLQGNFTVKEGFGRLLAGSGFEVVDTGSGAYSLRKIPMAALAPAAQSDQALPAITVIANQLGEITEHSRSYTPGTIATATRLPLTPRETPQSISVITRQQIDDFGLTSIDKVIERTPGVSIVTYDSERTEYWARGFAIQNFQYDGIPMQRDSGYSAGNTLSDMAIYDRVEVLKGATGLLTGSGDPGATINLVRKKPTRAFQGSLQAGVGSWDNYRTQADLSGALNQSGSVRARAVAAYQDRQSHQDHYQKQVGVFYGILEADLTPSTLLSLGVDYQDNKPKGSSWGGIKIFDTNGNFNDMPRSFNNGATWSHWSQYTRTAFATLEHTFDNEWVAKLQLNHQINGYDAMLGAAAGGTPNPADGSGTSLWMGKYVGKTRANAADFYASGPFNLFGRKHELVLGGSFTDRRWTNAGYSASGYNTSVSDYYGWTGHIPYANWGTPGYTNDETTRESGLYGTTRLNLRDDLKLIVGGRVSNYENNEQDMKATGKFVPYVGAVYDLDKNLSVYASYTAIFKPHSEKDETGKTIDPQTGENHEVGLKGSFFNGRLNASAAYFQLKQDNYADYVRFDTATNLDVYRVLQGVKTKGYEFEVSGQIARDWQLQAGYTHSVSHQEGERIGTLNPANQFSLYTSHKLGGALQGLTLGGGARWQDKTWASVTNPVSGKMDYVMGSRWLFDAMARYEFNKNLSASLNVNNLLDKKYHTIFQWYSTYTWGEPRSVMLNVNYKF